ncbi:MAG: hypothetical protein WBA57_00505 [Elainellaceae cyanobacterium]
MSTVDTHLAMSIWLCQPGYTSPVMTGRLCQERAIAPNSAILSLAS